MPENNQDTKNSNAESIPEEAPITLDVSQEQQAANEILSGELAHSKKMGLLVAIMFMAIGAMFLIVAQYSFSDQNTVIPFVFTVLGTATFLFGTGTSGVVFINKKEKIGAFYLSVAGGAGILAAIIFGAFIRYTPQIKVVFSSNEISREYQVELLMENAPIQSKHLPSMALLKINDTSMPTHRTDDKIVLVYRTSDPSDKNVTITGNLYFVSGSQQNGFSKFRTISVRRQSIELSSKKVIRVNLEAISGVSQNSPIIDLLPDFNDDGVL